MDKIYSRKRIPLPKFNFFFSSNDNNNKYLRKIVTITIILIIAFLVANNLLRAFIPIFEQECISKSKNISTSISNKVATSIMSRYTYEDLVTIYKDNNGNVSLIKSNVIPINEIISDVPIYILEEFNSNKYSDFEVSIGSLTGLRILSASGPKIKVKISYVGNIETDFKSEFISKRNKSNLA